MVSGEMGTGFRENKRLLVVLTGWPKRQKRCSHLESSLHTGWPATLPSTSHGPNMLVNR